MAAVAGDPAEWYASVCPPECPHCSCGKGPDHVHEGCPVHDARRGRWPWRAIQKMTVEERKEYIKNRPEELKRIPRPLHKDKEWKYCYDCWNYGPIEDCPNCINIDKANWAPKCPVHNVYH